MAMVAPSCWRRICAARMACIACINGVTASMRSLMVMERTVPCCVRWALRYVKTLHGVFLYGE